MLNRLKNGVNLPTSMLKDSSLISVMGVWEVMFLAQS